ncbi:hypothetical protein [Catenulispora rubra]|uniref:hypothetical protein n=1 Tax=Catenulispora rubra TaxID=280293 RepID=UPI0018927746|nr:hypothetical protein [Catenulispora rubra]
MSTHDRSTAGQAAQSVAHLAAEPCDTRYDAAGLVRRAFELAADVVEGAVARRECCGSHSHHRCGCGCHPGGDGGPCGQGGPGSQGGGDVPGRPTREPGTSTGAADGHPVTPGDLVPLPPRVWPGVRKNLLLPFLFLRANPGDTGTRPVSGPFWESPDVYILAGVAPDAAPAIPPALGQVAQAGVDNTVYAHVWNLGQAPAREVIVEFYWCNPSLGFNPNGLTKIGTAVTQLGDRYSGECHKVVKCPNSWQAGYVNGGHECLLVRAWDVAADPMTTPEWDARVNRHLGQRNIHVVPPGGPTGALKLQVGQLFGMAAEITVERHAPATMPWLQLHTGQRGVFPVQAVGTGQLTVAAPGQLGTGNTLPVAGDGAQVVFAAGDQAPGAGQAHVYRVTASQGGQVVGGYTVVHQG